LLNHEHMYYQAGTIYTYIGHVLCVCNPYQWLDIYGPSTVHIELVLA
jgi:myosin heavy subunit